MWYLRAGVVLKSYKPTFCHSRMLESFFCSLFLFNCLTSVFVCTRVSIKLVPSMPFDHLRDAETLSMLLHQVSGQTILLLKHGDVLYLNPRSRLGNLQPVDVFFFSW